LQTVGVVGEAAFEQEERALRIQVCCVKLAMPSRRRTWR
jgi:hypothetical protein